MFSGYQQLTGVVKLVFQICLGPVLLQCAGIPKESAEKKKSENIYLADPTIFEQDDRFYLYGTVEGNANNGFRSYTSRNLKDWQLTNPDSSFTLQKGDVFGTAGFWAPQVFAYGGKFYMAYVANENIAFAESNSPAGPFTQRIKEPLAAPVKQIDPYIFIDDDGRKYLYHVRLIEGNRIFVAEMTDDFSAIKPETVRECITATENWEHTAKTTWQWPVAEGPTVLKHKGTYYLIYTANDFRNPDYAVGYATSNSPLGPWKKYGANPILTRQQIGQNGPGHGDFFQEGSNLMYVFHTHNTAEKVGPRKTALVKARFVETANGIDRLELETKNFHYLYQ